MKEEYRAVMELILERERLERDLCKWIAEQVNATTVNLCDNLTREVFVSSLFDEFFVVRKSPLKEEE